MIKVLADGEQQYRLEASDGRRIGWIHGQAIRFGGFASERDAMKGTLAAWPALEAALSREYAGWPRSNVADHALRITRDGVEEWISDGRVPLARLIRPSSNGSGPSYSIEFKLPTYATEGAAISVARTVALALRARVSPQRRASARAGSAVPEPAA